MKNIKQLFKGEEYLMDFAPVDELIEYCRELEGNVLEKRIEDSYDKEHMLKSMLQDILNSCIEMEENNLLNERYPDLYKKLDAESLVKNLKEYILDMNAKNSLGI